MQVIVKMVILAVNLIITLTITAILNNFTNYKTDILAIRKNVKIVQ